MKILLVLCFLLAAVVLLPGCTQFGNRDSIDIQNHTDSYINNKSNSSYLGSFTDKGGKTCAVDGKPIIRMYSTTWCPHCRWIKNTFDRVMKEYMDANKIIAHHWEIESINGTLKIVDDTLTEGIDSNIPVDELLYFREGNDRGAVPFYSFGCRYVRIGNRYESSSDLASEENEFRMLIENIIREVDESK